jgi:hypothetical protein
MGPFLPVLVGVWLVAIPLFQEEEEEEEEEEEMLSALNCAVFEGARLSTSSISGCQLVKIVKANLISY